MVRSDIRFGMNTVEVVAALERIGAHVAPVTRTGELRARHPLIRRCVRFNGRRKDAPMVLIKFGMEIIRLTTTRH